MPNLDLKDAHVGMVLGQDILGSQGQLLLRAGIVLSDKHLQVLYANHVQHVVVGVAPPSAQNTPANTETIGAHIEERFRICDAGQPLIQELRHLCRKRLIHAHGGPDDD